MANTIKLKRGSGSDPSASDLVVGEPAIRTDTGELFLKKDDNSVAKISGGGITNWNDVINYNNIGADHFSVSTNFFNPIKSISSLISPITSFIKRLLNNVNFFSTSFISLE